MDEGTISMDDGGTAKVWCDQCGAAAEEPPLTWVNSAENGRTVYYCDTCARQNLRAIEARLDVAVW